MRLYDIDTIFDFGKFKGKNLKEVFIEDILYLDWCVERVDWFVITDQVKLLCIDKMKKALYAGSTNITEYEEQLERALVSNFESNCKKKKSLYLLRENNKPNANVSDYINYDDVDDEYFKQPRYNFVQDVLGGDPSAMWNID